MQRKRLTAPLTDFNDDVVELGDDVGGAIILMLLTALAIAGSGDGVHISASCPSIDESCCDL